MVYVVYILLYMAVVPCGRNSSFLNCQPHPVREKEEQQIAFFRCLLCPVSSSQLKMLY